MKPNCTLLLFISFCIVSNVLHTQSLEIELSNNGIVFPRMNSETRDALVAIQGQCIYNIDFGSIDCYDGEGWSRSLTNKTNTSDYDRRKFEVLRPSELFLSNSYGWDIAMHGSHIIVGDAYENDIGAAYIYHHNGIEWYQQARLFEENGESDFQFGHSVSISNDYAIIGSVLTKIEEEEVGVVYVYKRDNQSWSVSDTLIAFDGEDADRFGESVMIHDDFLIISATSASGQYDDQGKAYIYHLQNDEWTLDTVLSPLVLEQFPFGEHVAITDKYAVVSVPSDRSIVGETGSVFIYEKGPLGWELDQVIRPSDGSIIRSFGSAIGIEGEDLMIGAVSAIANSDSSQVYYFRKNNVTDSWEEQQIFKNSDGPHIRDFGRYLSLSQNTAAFLTQDATDNFNRISQVRIYKKEGGSWNLTKNFTPFGLSDRLISVDLHDDWLLLGSSSFSTDGVLKGGLFIF